MSCGRDQEHCCWRGGAALWGNTVMINVLRCHQSDRAAVIERQNKLLVRYKNIYTCGEAAEGQACF